jgi:hypothetical protein
MAKIASPVRQNNANKLDRCTAGLTRIYGDPE